MPMYNVIEYSDNYSKRSGSLRQCCQNILTVNNNGDIVEFNRTNATDSFNFKAKITGKNRDVGTKAAELMVQLKYFSNLQKT